MLDQFIKSYNEKKYSYPTLVTHNGTVIALAMDETRQIFYKVLNLGDAGVANPLDVNFWTEESVNKGELRFPSELAQIGYGVADQVMLPALKTGQREPDPKMPVVADAEKDFFRSTTARLTADAPFQVLSDGRFIYVFRQAIASDHPDMVKVEVVRGTPQAPVIERLPIVNATLLVDRFVLVDTTLQPKMEVRYRRSRSKFNPQSRKDSLGAKDMEDNAFYEPTQELAFVGNLNQGRFTVLLLPTAVAEIERWQIFTHNAKTGLIDSFNVERGADGLFNTRGTQFYTCTDHPEVFEQRAGQCVMSSLSDPSQSCEKRLIPLVSVAGYAESALRFDGVNNLVDLGQGVNPGNQFTLEAWVYPTPNSATKQTLLSGTATAGQASAAPTLVIAEGNRVRLSFGAGTHQYAVLTEPGALTPYTWNHLAATYDGVEPMIFVNGAPCLTTYLVDGEEQLAAALRDKQPALAPIKLIGATQAATATPEGFIYNYVDYFTGTIDEIRIWSRARSADELRSDSHQRLVGQEPGLVGYWRFDEATGSNVYDQTDRATHGTLHGDPLWETSSAPVGENMGLCRSSFRLVESRDDTTVERAVVSGLSALLYYQQENSPIPLGYDRADQDKKPLKHNARVMLALATQARNATDGKQQIAALDFAVSRAGKLAQAQDTMVLTTLNNTALSNETLDNISNLEQQIEQLTDEINQLDDTITRLTGETSESARDGLQQAYEASLAALESAQKKLTAAQMDPANYYHTFYNQGKGKYAEVFPDHDKEIRVENKDWSSGNRDNKLWYMNPTDDTAEYYFLKSKGRDTYAEAFASKNWGVYADNPYLDSSTDDKSWKLEFADGHHYLWNRGKQKYAETFGSSVKVDKDQQDKGNEDMLWRVNMVDDEWPNTAIADAQAALVQADNDRVRKKAALDNLPAKQEELQIRSQRRQQCVTEMQSAQGQIQEQKARARAAVALPMPLLYVDPYGLTIAGAVLGFAWTKATPQLFSSATGRLALYFQGTSDQFFVAYYKTLTEKARCDLPTTAPSQYVQCAARSTEAELDQLLITVSDRYLGRLAEEFTGQETISLDPELDRELAMGASLLIGPNQLTVREAAAKGTKSIKIYNLASAKKVDASAGTPVGLVETGDSENCTVLITGAKLSEIWQQVPREPRRFAEVLNGLAGAPVFVGKAAVRQGEVDSLTVTAGSNQKLAAGATLQLGSLTLEVAAAVNEGDTRIPIKPVPIAAPDTLATSGAISLPVANAALTSDGQFVGFGAVTHARLDSLNLLTGTSRPLPAGTTLLVNQRSLGASPQTTRVTLRASAKAGATTLLIEETELRVNAEQTTVDMVAYDYATQAQSSKTPSNLANGSLLVVVNGTNAAGKIKIGECAAPKPTTTCSWIADAPGDALLFDGQNTYAGLASPTDSTLAPLAAAGDLTLEAWVQPGPVQGTARLIQFHQSPQANYALGLRQTPSALRFDGSADHIILPNAVQIDATAGFTIEAWVRYAAFQRWSPIIEFGNGRDPGDNILLANFANTNTLAFGLYKGTTEQIYYAPDVLEIGEWMHLAASVDTNGQIQLYKNGVPLKLFDKAKNLLATAKFDLPLGDIERKQNYIAKSNFEPVKDVYYGSENFKGEIDEVRLWHGPRTTEEITLNYARRLRGDETNLAGYWHFDEGRARDYSPNKNEGTLRGAPQLVLSPMSAAAAFASVNEHSVESKETVPAGEWSHLAAVFDQAYAVQFNGQDAYLDCGNDTTLDISGDLTIEAYIWLDALNTSHAILGRGVMDDGTDDDVPYALYIDGEDNRLAFAFEGGEKGNFIFKTKTALDKQIFYKVAVTRHFVSNVIPPEKEGGKPDDQSYTEIKLYINGEAAEIGQWKMKFDPAQAKEVKQFVPNDITESNGKTSHQFVGEDKDKKKYVIPTIYQFRGDQARNSDKALTIGRTYLEDMQEAFFHGAISEVRIWNLPRADNEIGVTLNGRETGLVSWWRFEENSGVVAFDAKSNNHARFRGGAQWCKDLSPTGSQLTLYRNGTPMTPATSKPVLAAAESQFTLGALANTTLRDCYKGQLDEVRIWKITRTQEQIQDSMFERLLGERDSLIARYTFNHTKGAQIIDSGLGGNTLIFNNGAKQPLYVLSTAPLATDLPAARNAILGIKTGFHRPIHSPPAVVEYADMQFDAANNLIGVLKRCYAFIQDRKWQLVTGFKVGNLITEWVGQVQRKPQLIGFIEGAPPVPSENLTHSGVVLGEREDYNGATAVELTQAASTTYTYSADKDTGFDMAVEGGLGLGWKLEQSVGLGIGTESINDVGDVNFKIGARLSFENSLSWLESASTGSGLTTTKASRMELRGKYENEDEIAYPELGRRFLPDNVGYALVQSETNDVFALRLQHNYALVAYQMRPNPDIEKDWNIITFPLNPRYTKQGTLDGKVGLQPDADYPNALAYSPDSSYFKPIEAYALKNRIRREEAELQTYYDNYDAGAKGRRQDGAHFSNSDVAEGRTLAKLPQFRGPDDPEQRLGKTDSPARKKRNLVNTYVWTADGGLFAETEETSDVQQESSGGAYSFKGMAGLAVEGDIILGGIRVLNLELQAMFGGHMNLTVNKSWDSETAFGMNVEVGTESDLYQRDENGNVLYDRSDPRNPKVLKEAGKVDAYRFMTFYLEPRSDHFDLFFNKIVEPIWLAQSNEPAAVALREAQTPQAATKPACWRLMHRVTYVSRILPPVATNPAAPALEKTLQTLDIDSNYELIKKLEPFVKHKTGNATEFNDAIETALQTYLPELLPHKAAIKQYLGLYFGVSEDMELGNALEEGAGGAGSSGTARQAPVITIDKLTAPVSIYNTAALVATIKTGGTSDQTDDLTLRWSRVSGPDEVTFSNEGAAATDVTFTKPGVYVLQLKATSGGRTSSARTTLVVGVRRVTEGLQALYTFTKGSRDTLVYDVSGVAQPMDLTIANPNAVSWVNGRSGLIINQPTILSAAQPARALTQAVKASQEITLEAWIKPSAAATGDLARIVTLANGTAARNVTLGQSSAGYHARLRTTATNPNASDQTLTAGAVIPGDLAQVVYTRDKTGTARLYTNGVEVGNRLVIGQLDSKGQPISDQLANWDETFTLALANEYAGKESHPWLGELRLVALYSRALTVQEVQQNFAVAPTVTATAAQATILRPGVAQLHGAVTKNRVDSAQTASGMATTWSGPPGVTFGDANKLNTTASFPDCGVYALRLTADDGLLAAFAEVKVTVNQAPEVTITNKQIVTWPDAAQLVVAITNSGLAVPGGIVALSWTQQSGPGVATITPVAGKSNTWAASFSVSGIYVLRLTADNGYAQTTSAITVVANRRPVVIAGPDQTITLPGSARLEGLVIDDGLPRQAGKITVEWKVVEDDAEKVRFDDKSADHTIARFSGKGTFHLQLTAKDGPVEAYDEVTIKVEDYQRETDGLQALYIFEEGAGDTIYDVSGISPALNLKISDRSAVSWLAGSNGLAITKPTKIASDGVVGKLKGQKEITIEAWVKVKPENNVANTHAGIVTLTSATARNVVLAQHQSSYEALVAVKANNQSASQTVIAGSVTADLTQLVYTRDSGGKARLYINGAKVENSGTGNLDDMSGARLVLGDEAMGGHPWLGELYLVAIYNRALGEGDIKKNFEKSSL